MALLVVEVYKEKVAEEDPLLMVVQVVEVVHPLGDLEDQVVEADLKIGMQLHQVSISQVHGYSMHLMVTI